MLRFDIESGQFTDDSEDKLRFNTILHGEGKPDKSLGNKGDFYIETASWEIYQKTDEGWGEGIPLKGKDGTDGSPGKDGESIFGKDGNNGEDGEDGVGIADISQPLINKLEILLTNGESKSFLIPNGKDGREIELQASATHIMWRYTDGEWVNLAELPKAMSGGGGRLRLRDLADYLVAGSNISINTDYATKKITISSTGGGHVIQDEGTPLTQRPNLNFVGAGVTATDDAGNDATVITIPTTATPTLQQVLAAGNTSTINIDLSTNTKLLLGSVGEIYTDGTDLIINPVSGITSIGVPSAGGGTKDLVANYIGLAGSPISSTSIVNVNVTGSARAALSFTMNYTGSATAFGPVAVTSTDNGTSTTGFTYLNFTSSQQTQTDAHATLNQYGYRADMGIQNTVAITTAGNKNIVAFHARLSQNGRASAGTNAGDFVRVAFLQNSVTAINGAPDSSITLGAHLNNDLQLTTTAKIILDGAVGDPTAAGLGNTTIAYNSGSSRVELDVDGTDAIYYTTTQISNLLYTAFSGRINLASQTSSTVEGDVWRDSTQKTPSVYINSLQQQLVSAFFTQTANATVANTTTETSVIGTGVGTKTIPANFFVAGKTVELMGSGIFSTALVPGNVTLRFKLGSTTIASATITTMPSSASNVEFNYCLMITCRTTGATGTVMAGGGLFYFTKAGTEEFAPLNNAGATTTIDTTATQAIDLTWQWATASASNTATGTICAMESLN